MQQLQLEINLTTIANKSIIDIKENDDFITYLKTLNANEIDNTVFELEQIIAPKIDCTKCGNCCKSLMINVEEFEANYVADFLNMSRKEFDETYIEKSESGKMVINKIPCHFLNDNKCNIYLNRFASCKEFPALHLPQIQKRLFTIFMHYGRCPIIFNVMEELKKIVEFAK